MIAAQESRADDAAPELDGGTAKPPPKKPAEPPRATVARRAKSYSDFYDAAKLYDEREGGGKKVNEGLRGLQLNNELDCLDWFRSVKGKLVEGSHERYQ